jgi:hypothetical protein
MQAAPQVLYPLGRPRLLQSLLAAGGLVTLGLMAAVAASQPGLHLVVIMGGCLLLAGSLSMRALVAPGSGLWWDGECWHLQGAQPVSGQLVLALDLQRALLLRWTSPCVGSDPASHWLWIEQHADPVIWKDVRRAIYWHAH